MATGSQNLTTYYAKRIIGDASAASSNAALLQTGTGVTADTWILNRTNRATDYGIIYNYDYVSGTTGDADKIEFVGKGVVTAWVQLDTGDFYVAGKVGIGYNPNTSGNTYKLYVDGTTYLNGNTINAGHLYPDPTNIYDLGSNSLRWRDLYLAGQVNYIMDQDTSNYKTPISFRDTSNSQIAEIGFHNTGDTDGALILIPRTHSDTNSWAGSVGLYIGKTTFKWENNIILHEGNYRKHIFANKNRSRSTLTVTDSSWSVTSDTDVFGLAFKDTGLTYTPSGGSATASSDTGDWRAWLTCAADANTVTLNMRIDGTWQASKFIGPLQGNADTATTASYLSTPEASGFTTDGSGNFTHKRTTNTDYWHLNKNAGNAIFSVYWETGAISSTGNMILTKNGDSYFEVKCPDTGVRVELGNSGSTNHGLWSSGYWNGSAYTASPSWMIYRNASGTTIVNGNCTGSSGSCTGNAATATTATYCPRLTRIADNTAATDTNQFSTDGLNVRWYSATGKISGQPAQYGFLFTVATGAGSNEVHQFWASQPDGNLYHRGTNGSSHASPPAFKQIWCAGNSVTGAVWNDYAEYRTSTCNEPGYCVFENGDDTLSKTTKRLQHFAGIISDTWGFSQGETKTAKTPIAVSGRVLAYTYRNRNEYQPGDCVCAAPDGTVDIMTRDEVMLYSDKIVGTVSCVPTYEEWGGGEGADRDPVKVNGRIWIKVR